MLPIILAIVGSYVIAELYKNHTTPEQKKKWEGFVKTHHGEAGIIGIAGGILLKSPTMIGTGIGLAIHDKDDAPKWFVGDKFNNKSNYNQVTGYA
jgi:hypothetical protein